MNGKFKQRHKDKTVYVLGAGFSFTAGSPLLRDFIPAAFDILKQEKKGGEVVGEMGACRP